MENNVCAFDQLPDEVIIETLLFVDDVDIAVFSTTCKRLRLITEKNELWRNKISRMVGIVYSSDNKVKATEKKLYHKLRNEIGLKRLVIALKYGYKSLFSKMIDLYDDETLIVDYLPSIIEYENLDLVNKYLNSNNLKILKEYPDDWHHPGYQCVKSAVSTGNVDLVNRVVSELSAYYKVRIYTGNRKKRGADIFFEAVKTDNVEIAKLILKKLGYYKKNRDKSIYGMLFIESLFLVHKTLKW